MNSIMKHLLSLCAVALFFILAVASTEPARVQTPSQMGGPPKAIKVAAGELIREYTVNYVSADKRYSGQLLLVTGIVESVDMENLRVVLSSNNGKIFCAFFPDQSFKAQRIVIGSEITVFGVFEGMNANFSMRGCLLP